MSPAPVDVEPMAEWIPSSRRLSSQLTAQPLAKEAHLIDTLLRRTHPLYARIRCSEEAAKEKTEGVGEPNATLMEQSEDTQSQLTSQHSPPRSRQKRLRISSASRSQNRAPLSAPSKPRWQGSSASRSDPDYSSTPTFTSVNSASSGLPQESHMLPWLDFSPGRTHSLAATQHSRVDRPRALEVPSMPQSGQPPVPATMPSPQLSPPSTDFSAYLRPDRSQSSAPPDSLMHEPHARFALEPGRLPRPLYRDPGDQFDTPSSSRSDAYLILPGQAQVKLRLQGRRWCSAPKPVSWTPGRARYGLEEGDFLSTLRRFEDNDGHGDQTALVPGLGAVPPDVPGTRAPCPLNGGRTDVPPSHCRILASLVRRSTFLPPAAREALADMIQHGTSPGQRGQRDILFAKPVWVVPLHQWPLPTYFFSGETDVQRVEKTHLCPVLVAESRVAQWVLLALPGIVVDMLGCSPTYNPHIDVLGNILPSHTVSELGVTQLRSGFESRRVNRNGAVSNSDIPSQNGRAMGNESRVNSEDDAIAETNHQMKATCAAPTAVASSYPGLGVGGSVSAHVPLDLHLAPELGQDYPSHPPAPERQVVKECLKTGASLPPSFASAVLAYLTPQGRSSHGNDTNAGRATDAGRATIAGVGASADPDLEEAAPSSGSSRANPTKRLTHSPFLGTGPFILPGEEARWRMGVLLSQMADVTMARQSAVLQKERLCQRRTDQTNTLTNLTNQHQICLGESKVRAHKLAKLESETREMRKKRDIILAQLASKRTPWMKRRAQLKAVHASARAQANCTTERLRRHLYHIQIQEARAQKNRES